MAAAAHRGEAALPATTKILTAESGSGRRSQGLALESILKSPTARVVAESDASGETLETAKRVSANRPA